MKLLLALSLVANLLLAGFWFKHTSAGAMPAANAPTNAPAPAAANNPPAPSLARLPEFAGMNWTDLETDDLRVLIKRLRAAGCPEETVQDIILADVNRRFTARYARAFQDLTNRPYWQADKSSPADKQDQAERWRRRKEQSQAFQEEKSTLLVKLLGVDPEKERRLATGLPASPEDWQKATLAFLPESQQDAAARYLTDFSAKLQDFYAHNPGPSNPDTRAGQRRLEEEKMQGLAQILSPAELREYQLRLSQTALQVMSELHGVPLTRGEYEALFDLRQKYGDSVMLWSDVVNDPAKRTQAEENRKTMQADIAFALGADKAAELVRANDYTYQQLLGYSKHYQLPADAAAKVYAFKQTAEAGAQQIMADNSLDPNQKAAALHQIRAETENSVKAVLGEPAFQRYQKRNGWWLQNLAPNKNP